MPINTRTPRSPLSEQLTFLRHLAADKGRPSATGASADASVEIRRVPNQISSMRFERDSTAGPSLLVAERPLDTARIRRDEITGTAAPALARAAPRRTRSNADSAVRYGDGRHRRGAAYARLATNVMRYFRGAEPTGRRSPRGFNRGGQRGHRYAR